MLFPIEFSQSIVRYYLIEFLYVKITFYVAGMLQDHRKKCCYDIFISMMFTCFWRCSMMRAGRNFGRVINFK
ncbi:hypothetical protein D3C87_1419510 [compost metagenome]